MAHRRGQPGLLPGKSGAGDGGRSWGGNSHLDVSVDTTASGRMSVASVMLDPAKVKALREIKALRDEGIFTEEEFREQKALLLGAPTAQPADVQRPLSSLTESSCTGQDRNTGPSRGSTEYFQAPHAPRPGDKMVPFCSDADWCGFSAGWRAATVYSR